MKEISFKKDIVKDVCEKLGIAEEKVEHVFNFLIHHMETMIKDPEVVSIHLPWLGDFYVKMGRAYWLMENSQKGKDKHFKSLYRKKGKIVRTLDIHYNDNLHYKSDKLLNPYFTKELDKEEMEVLQNEKAERNVKSEGYRGDFYQKASRRRKMVSRAAKGLPKL